MSVTKMVTIRHYTDKRGTLGVVQPPDDVDFEIKRVFWLTECTEARGGLHTNRCQYLLIALHGSCMVTVGRPQSMGAGSSPVADPVRLTHPDTGVLVQPGYAVKVSRFSDDALCLVLADGAYE